MQNILFDVLPSKLKKKKKIEGKVRLLVATSLIQLALSDLNHDLTNMNLGFRDMLDTCVSALVNPNEVFLGILRNTSLKPSGSVIPLGA